jgi:hypothetical protein
VGSTSNRRLDVGLQLDEDRIANCKLASSAVLVGLGFHQLLSMIQIVLDQLVHQFALLEPLLDSWDWASAIGINAPVAWFVTIQSDER